jgi:cytochrome c peroxidase
MPRFFQESLPRTLLLTLSGLFVSAVGLARTSSEPVLPLPQTVKIDAKLAAFGKIIFEDPRLSRTMKLSCATCHDVAQGGSNPADVSGPRKDVYNTPTVMNIGFHFRYFWDGRAASLEEQAALTIHSPTVYNMTWPEVLTRVQNDPSYQQLAAYLAPGRPLEPSMITKAIAEYEKSLLTPNAPFDKYLRGDDLAISAEARLGYQRFKDFGCSSCHQGMLLGANSFQKFGVFDTHMANKNFSRLDYGRFNVTGLEDDRFMFKVPSLRNVALTAPYFHDGSAATLEQAVRYMGLHQVRRHLSSEEIRSLVEFLKSLTGEWQGKNPK